MEINTTVDGYSGVPQLVPLTTYPNVVSPSLSLGWILVPPDNYYLLRGRCGGGAAPSATNKFGRAEGTRPNLFSPQTTIKNI